MNYDFQVPLVEDGDLFINDSCAALRYLATTRKVDEHWYPRQDPVAQVRVDEYLHWHHGNVRMNCMMFFQHRWMLPFMSKRAPDWDAVEEWRKKMNDTLDVFERVWLDGGKKKFITGDKVSVADIMACCEMEQPSITG